MEKEILKLNGITLENSIAIEDATSERKRDTQNFKKILNVPF